MSEANNITFAQAKTSLLYHPTINIWYNTLYLAGKDVYEKGRDFPVLFDFCYKLLYGRYANAVFFCNFLAVQLDLRPVSLKILSQTRVGVRNTQKMSFLYIEKAF